MYEKYFNFTQLPFSIAPNPRFFYLSPQHREALAHLLFGISSGSGFVALTGEVGTGKTTLCRCLLEQLPDDVDIALIFNPRLNAKELLASLCDELRIPYPEARASSKTLIDLLNHHLLDAHARGRRTIVLIDEAQNLSFDVLEQVRLLTNLETNETKLLQIILVGQPELRDLLDGQNLRQLAQRITARYHLEPLSLADSQAYIAHRIGVSGVTKRIFTPRAVAWIHRASGGIPRLINLICDRALLGAYTLGRMDIDGAIVRKAISEVLPSSNREIFGSLPWRAIAMFSLLAVAGLMYQGSPAVSALMASLSTGKPFPTVALSPAPTSVAKVVSSESQTEQQPVPIVEAPEGSGASASASPSAPKLPTAPAQTVQSASVAPASQEQAPEAAGPLENASAALKATPLALAQRIRDPGLTLRSAFARLLVAWQLPLVPENLDICLALRSKGMRCWMFKGTLQQLRNLDFPAILEFVLEDGSRRHATLIRISHENPVLAFGSDELEYAPEEILSYWRGDAIILWKPPFNVASASLGDNGDTVGWLRSQLHLQPGKGAEPVFDESLKGRLIAFQLQHGLLPDGKAGPHTMIRLQKLASPTDAAPTLGANGH